MKPLLLTVVIPTHNRPDSLQSAVESVRMQTDLPHEIVIVDDGSYPVVEPEIFNDSPIPVHIVRHEEARGVAAARNVGVDHASGDFVAFLDDDDTWVPWKLQFVADCLSSHPDADIVIHRTGYQPSSRTDSQQCSVLGSPLRRMLHEQPPHLDGVVVRRSLHLDTPFDESFRGAEDLDYLIRLAKSGAQIMETMAVLAVLGDAEASEIGIDSRIQGRLELLNRHPEILADPEARSFFYVRLGHLQRRAGNRSSAVRWFLRAGRHRPASPLVWKGLVHCLIPTSLVGNHPIRRSDKTGTM